MGDPVDHSLSPLLHNTAFAELGLDWASLAFPVRAGSAAAALDGMRALRISGMSVTMPHKEAVAALVDERSSLAERLGAVNCVIRRNDRLVGENTDGAGFVAALARAARFDPQGARCVVVGAGGAARAIVASLADAGARQVLVVNRTASRASVAAALAGDRGAVGRPEDVADADLVVNATPVGMAGTTGAEAVPLVDAATLGAGQVAADIVYRPARTAWLARAETSGATVVGGLGMLVHQAAAQLAAWTGIEPPLGPMWAAAEAAVGG